MLAAILTSGSVLAACNNNDGKDNKTTVDVTVLTEWQAGKTVSNEVVEAHGGVDKCFAAEPIPDGVWARMQGKTYKENPHIGRGDLRHIRALHWDYDHQMHVGEMICNKEIADRVTRILRHRCVTTTRHVSATASSLAPPSFQNMPVDWLWTSTHSIIPTTRTELTAPASSSLLRQLSTVTAQSHSPIR